MDAFPFCCPIQVRWRDLDALGHVNNATFATYLEVARAEAWRQRFGGVSAAEMPFVVARLEIDYRRPLTLADSVQVGLWVAAIGGASFDFAYRIDAGERVAATARTVQVVVGPNGRPVRLSPGLRERLETLRLNAG